MRHTPLYSSRVRFQSILPVILMILLVILFVKISPAFSSEVSSLIDRGKELLGENRLDEALGLFEQASREAPQDARPPYYKGVIHYRKKEYPKALQSLQEALRRDPLMAEAGLLLGKVFEEEGRFSAARNVYWKVTGIPREAVQEKEEARQGVQRVTAKELFVQAHRKAKEGRMEDAAVLVQGAAVLAPNDPVIQAGTGDIYTRSGRFGDALKAFQRAVELDPKRVDDRFRLGALYQRLGLYKEAKESFEQALQQNPPEVLKGQVEERLSQVQRNIEARDHFDKASRLMDEKRWDEARRELEQVLSIEPKNPSALFAMGRAFYNLNDKEQALAYLDRAVEVDPGMAAAWTQKGAALEDLQRFEEAMNAYERALAASKTTEEVRRETQERIGTLKPVLEAKKRTQETATLIEQQDIAAAIREAEALLTVKGKDVRVYMILAGLYIKAGRLKDAAALLERAVALSPKDPEIFLTLGQVYEALGDFSRSATAYQRVAELAPMTPRGAAAAAKSRENKIRGHFIEARKRKTAGDYEGALKEIRDILEISPKEPVALYNAGVLYDRLERYKEAKESLEKAVESAPDYVQAYYLLGIINERIGDFDRAEEAYNRVIALVPETEEGPLARERLKRIEESRQVREHLRRTMEFLESGDLKAAHQEAEVIITLAPKYYLGYFQLGLVLEQEGDIEAAIEALRKSIDLRPDFAQALLRAGFLYEDQELFEEAKEMYRRAEKAGEGQREGDIAHLRLQALRKWQGSLVVSHLYNTNISYGKKAKGAPSSAYALGIRFLPIQSKRYRFSTQVSSSRSIFYTTQFVSDGVSFSINAGATSAEKRSISTSYTYSMTLVEGKKQSENKNYSISFAARPEEIPTSLSLTFGMGRPRSRTNKASEMNRYHVGVSASQRFGPRNSFEMGYAFSTQQNLHEAGNNYANRSHGISFNYTRTLGNWGSVSGDYDLSEIFYSNPDSTSFFQQFRKNESHTLGGTFRSRLSDRLSLTFTLKYVDSRTNLPRPTAEELLKLEEILTSPIPTVGGGYRQLTADLSFNFMF